MGTVILFGVLVGLDNLQISTAIGLMAGKVKRKWILVAAFALFEMLMPLLGLLVGHSFGGWIGEWAEYVGPAILFVLGIVVIVMALNEKEPQILAESPWMIIGLPLAMSMDNLFTGVGLGTMGYPILLTALIIGLLSGSMVILGLFVGEKVRKVIPSNVEMISGFYLVGMSLFFLLIE